MALPPPFLKLHRWLALALAPLLLLQGLTGIALLYRAELMRLGVPAPLARTTAGAAAPLSDLAAAAASTEPGTRVTRIFLPATPRDFAFVQMARGDGSSRFAALDPQDGRVLATGSIWRFPAETALQLHYRLNSGRMGMVVVALNGAALVLLAFTGALHWWPGRGRVLKALAIRAAAPPRARLRQWHRTLGVLLLPLVLFSAVTGLLLVVPDLSAPPAPAAVPLPPPDAAQVDRAFASAQAAFPGALARDVRFPPTDRIDVNFHAPRHGSLSVDVASVQLSDATVTKRLAAEDNPALWLKVLPLHSGAFAGLAGLAVLLIEGLVLMALAVTGPVMWWQARRRTKGNQ